MLSLKIQSSSRTAHRRARPGPLREGPACARLRAQGGTPTEGAAAPESKKGPSGPRKTETPCMSGPAYPPTDCTAVLSAMGSLTAGFGMGPGDPPLHGSAHAGRSPAREHIPFSIQGPPWGLHGAQRTVVSHTRSRR